MLKYFLFSIVIFLFSISSCKDEKFTPYYKKTIKKTAPTPVPSIKETPTVPPIVTPTTTPYDYPMGLDEGQVNVDYLQCTSLSEQGKRGYGKCNSGEGLVIVNDGKSQSMTCCPIQGQNIFNPNNLFIQRTGTCLKGEIATGMYSVDGGYYCSGLNTKYLTTGTPEKSIYVTGSSSIDDELRKIAASYHMSDTCICPKNTFMFGGKVRRDNVCKDTCVSIISVKTDH